MLAETYIEALLVDEELADQVWEAWDAGVVDDTNAWFPWWWLASSQQRADDMTSRATHGGNSAGI